MPRSPNCWVVEIWELSQTIIEKWFPLGLSSDSQILSVQPLDLTSTALRWVTSNLLLIVSIYFLVLYQWKYFRVYWYKNINLSYSHSNMLSGMGEKELELRATRNAHGKRHTKESLLRCKMKQEQKALL